MILQVVMSRIVVSRTVGKIPCRELSCRELTEKNHVANCRTVVSSVVAVYFYFTLPIILSALQFSESLLLLSLRR